MTAPEVAVTHPRYRTPVITVGETALDLDAARVLLTRLRKAITDAERRVRERDMIESARGRERIERERSR